ncbi:Laccase-3 [Hibiscus syriacus]|uniref:laccase n=1 Tax=Hibiscus syriacus TaxID=106335 RepID=A0A6A2Z4I4_HIBSY|nr:Laccase-3 [Hibiscus syriacus]
MEIFEKFSFICFGVFIVICSALSANAKVHRHKFADSQLHHCQWNVSWTDLGDQTMATPLKFLFSTKPDIMSPSTVQGQEGTLWWHAHSSWLRATVYGALIIRPKDDESYPFPKPKRETLILLGLGEWWDANSIDVVREATSTGAAPNVSDAYTINGQPGDLYKCSSKETTIDPIESRKTNLLRVINAALNQPLFFKVANHKPIVVGADASYTKPFTTSILMLGPGQTTDVLIRGDQKRLDITWRLEQDQSARNAPFDNTTTTAPSDIDESLFFTISLGLNNCPPNFRKIQCQGPNGTRFTARHEQCLVRAPKELLVVTSSPTWNSKGVTTDFPGTPPVIFDYTVNVSQSLFQPVPGTKLYKLKYGSRVQIVTQDTSIVTPENHPIHLHGYDFYIIAQGFGNFNPKTDTAKFNLVDPPLRNTVGVPVNGWAVIRFVADNPRVWLKHCHMDVHINWGLAMAFLVEN